MPRTNTQIATYHRLRKSRAKAKVIARATQMRRARKEIATRVSSKLSLLEQSGRPILRIARDQFEPYVKQHGKQWVTQEMKEVLPVYYGVTPCSLKNGNDFEGWLIVKLG